MKIKISIIIPTYNRPKYLEKSLLSLLNQNFSKADYEIFVVDNAPSNDFAKNIVNKYSETNPNLKYLREERLGNHYARNTGSKNAKAKILAFVDDDALYGYNWLKELYRTFENTKADCVGGKVIPIWETGKPLWLKEVPPSYYAIVNFGNQQKQIYYPELASVNFAIRKNVLFKVGGFNPEFFGKICLGDGETGLQIKLLSKKYIIYYQPKASCRHLIDKERISLSYVRRRAANEGAAVSYGDYKKHRFSKIVLALRSFYFAFYAFGAFAFYLWFLANKNFRYYHYAWTYSCLWRRANYEFHLMHSVKLIRLVTKTNWIKDIYL